MWVEIETRNLPLSPLVGGECHDPNFLRLIHRCGPNPHPDPLPGAEGVEHNPPSSLSLSKRQNEPGRLLPSEYTPKRGSCCPHRPRVVSRAARRRIAVAQRCELCNKGPSVGNNVSHANNKTKRRWLPNLQRVRARVDGSVRRLRVCTRCIRSGKVVKAA